MASICVGLVVVDSLLLEKLIVQHLAAAQENNESLQQIDFKPIFFAVSDILSKDVPSFVQLHIFERKLNDTSFPKFWKIIFRQAIPHCIESC